MILFEDNSDKDEDRKDEVSATTSAEQEKIAKTWLDIGNGKEALVKPASKSSVVSKPAASQGKVILNKKHARAEPGEFIYYANSWIKVEKIKKKSCHIKYGGKDIKIPLSECIKEIPINILVCSTNRSYIYSMLVNGRKTFAQLGNKLSKHNDMRLSRIEWYYNGKKIHNETRVEGINIKPNEKILCMLQEYEIKTFKRFKKVDEAQSWSMTKDKADALNITPTQPISLFGFGMYHCRDGPSSYLLSYQISLYDSVVKGDSILVTRVGNELILPIYFTANKEPIFVDAGVTLSIVLQYFDYDDSSKLYRGNDGEDYDSVEGNEPGLFKIDSHPESGNGTDIKIGQIPELYYAKTG